MKSHYSHKFVSAETAAKAVRDGDWVDYGFAAGFPELMDRAIAARRDELHDVNVRGGLVTQNRIEVVECDPEQKTFHYYSWHIGEFERKAQSRGLVRFCPMVMSQLPQMYRRKHVRVDVACVPVSRPDENGYCGLGITCFAWRAIFESARTVIFEINERLPRLQGVDGSHRVHLSEADYIVEGEHGPLPELIHRDPTPIDIEIARHVVAEIPDGAVLALGVGGVPYSIAKMLTESDRKDLGCWAGTISDAYMYLHRAGKLSGARKEVGRGLATWNMAMGTQALYDWLEAEPELFQPAPVEFVHSAARMGSMSNFISIMSGVQLDLVGQENGESMGTRQLSGIGGQPDFLEGAYRSEGGKGILCINSARRGRDGKLVSNIVPCISGGSTVSVPRTMIHYAATEYGVVQLTGKSLGERAQAMISIAHPDFREELSRYARENFY